MDRESYHTQFQSNMCDSMEDMSLYGIEQKIKQKYMYLVFVDFAISSVGVYNGYLK